jgi:hypothetical protein
MTMQGSLDQPPIVIRSSQKTSLWMLLASIVFVAGGVLIARDPTQNPVMGYLGIAFFGAGIPLFAYRLIRPDVLTVAPDGITWRTPFRTASWRWDDVRNFRPYAPGGRTISKHLGFDFTDDYHLHSKGLRRTAKTLTGVEGSLGGGWELSAADLADLLTTARTRWTRMRPA